MDPDLIALFPTIDGAAGPSPAPLRMRVQRTPDDFGVNIEPARSDSASIVGPESRDAAAETFRDTSMPRKTLSQDRYLARIEREVVKGAVDMFSPRCLGHMTSVLPAFTRSVGHLVNALNQNLVKVEASPTMTMLERQTLAMLHRLVYGQPADVYSAHVQDPDSTFGIMTGGGTIANITALWIARNAALSNPPLSNDAGRVQKGIACKHLSRSTSVRHAEPMSAPVVEEDGVSVALAQRGFEGAAIIGSTSMHYSIEKAAALLGLGARNLLRVPTDREQRIDIGALQRAVEDCHKHSRRVIAIVGVAGSTDCGSIDPLVEMAGIARRAGAHFHVDAAWGGPLLFSKQHARKLHGIDLADSVSFDGHKQMYLPVGTGMLLLRDFRAARVIEKHARYMLQDGSGDLGSRSLEGSREGVALFVHAALNVIGAHGYERLIDENLRRAQLMAEMIRARDEFELLHEPQTNIVVYRYIPASLRRAMASARLTSADSERVNACNERLQKLQYAAGRSYVSRTTLDGGGNALQPGTPVVALRAVLANPFTTAADLRAVLDEQAVIGASQDAM